MDAKGCFFAWNYFLILIDPKMSGNHGGDVQKRMKMTRSNSLISENRFSTKLHALINEKLTF